MLTVSNITVIHILWKEKEKVLETNLIDSTIIPHQKHMQL